MEKLFEIFGEPALEDRLELLAYNSLPGACTGDFFFHQYDRQANQVNVSVAKRGFDNSDLANLYGVAPHYPCCTFNMHHAWRTGDEFSLTLPMRVRTESRFNNAIAVLRGPLYFSLRIGQDYHRLDEGRPFVAAVGDG